MKKLSKNKKIMIPIIALLLVIAMAGTALAATSSYSESVPPGEYRTEYSTHVYSSSSYSQYIMNCTSPGCWFTSRAVLYSTGQYASASMNVFLGGVYYTTSLYSSYRSSAYAVRARIYNTNGYNQINNVYGRYGLQ